MKAGLSSPVAYIERLGSTAALPSFLLSNPDARETASEARSGIMAEAFFAFPALQEF